MNDCLTRYVSGLSELLHHLRVDGDHHVLLALHVLVPRFYLLSYPGAEGSTNYGSTDIDYPLLRDLLETGFVRKVIHDVLLLRGEGADMLQGQVLVARHVDCLDLVVRQVLLATVDQVLEL